MSPRARAALAVVIVGCAVAAACRRAPLSGPQRMRVTSSDFRVSGEYSSVKLDRVDGLAILDGRARLRGAPADLTVNLPNEADPSRATRHWAFVTDFHASGHRLVTFTHSETVKDVSAELPDSEAPLYFLTFAARSGQGEVLVFTTGDIHAGAAPVFGHIIIHPK